MGAPFCATKKVKCHFFGSGAQKSISISMSSKVAPIFAVAAAASSTDPLVVELRKENAALKKENAELRRELSKKRKAPDGGGASNEPSKKAKTPGKSCVGKFRFTLHVYKLDSHCIISTLLQHNARSSLKSGKRHWHANR